MSELSMMVTITERSKLTTFLSFYRERQVPVQFISLALGTASNETLNYLGLERSDKCVFASFVTDEKWEELRRGLRRELQIDVPGMGIAFTVPLSSIGGRRELQFLTEHQNYQKGEESTMKDTKYELLVVIANHGRRSATPSTSFTTVGRSYIVSEIKRRTEVIDAVWHEV